jgi:hypothetical protein
MQQMNAIASGGIASMMRGMPQGMPQPKPQPAGIALSSINEIANAQGTKTVPEGLKPLLALEQALSQVKAAQNQQALQQQIPQGTIQDQMTAQAEQTLQQARGTSPQQMAPQVAGASQQQEQQKQAMMQKLMQGIARAPGAQQMPGMAAGGIVAFQDGGLTKGYDRDYMDARRFGIDLSPYDSPEKRAEKLERVRKMREFEKYMEQNRAEIPREEPPVSSDTPEAEQQRLLGRFPAPEAPQIQTPPMRMPPAQVTSKVPVPRLSAAVPGQEPSPGVAQLGAQVVKPEAMGQGISPAMGPQIPGPEAARRMRQDEAAKVYGPSEEETKLYEEQMARLRQEAQPKDQRWYERLGALAPYLAQQRIDPSRGGIAGGLGRIAVAGQQMGAAEQAEREKRQARIDALQKQRMDQLRSGRVAGFESGIGAEAAAREAELKEKDIAERRFGTTEASRMAQAQIDAADRRAKEQSGATTDLQRRINLFKNDPETYKSIFGKEEKNVAFEALKIKADLLGKQLTGTTPLMGDAKKRVEQELAMVESALSKLAGLGGAAQPSSGVARPASQAEFDALPKGARFINPADGKEMIKN